MTLDLNRRVFLKRSSLVLAGVSLGWPSCQGPGTGGRRSFPLSLAEWSLNRALYGGRLDHLDFPRYARDRFGIEAVEYVNSFFMERARDRAYLAELNRRAGDAGVKQLLIMVDGEGALGDPSEEARLRTVENHKKWLEAAAELGCHSIRVNAASAGTEEEQAALCADGARRLVEAADGFGLNVIVENHGGLSSNGRWLSALMKRVDHPRFGTLPDFGNFYEYDRYQGVAELMPYAKAVSAKSRSFDEAGNETETDYFRMLKIVGDSGYRGYLGIEYEGEKLSEDEGILATKRLIERVMA